MGRVAENNKLQFLRAYNLGMGTFLGLLSLILPRKNRIIFNSTVNRFYNFNSKYLFEYVLQKGEYPAYFIIDDEVLREKLTKTYGNHFISTRGLKNKLFILSSKVWVTSTMETPLGGIFLSWRRFVYHLSHGIPVKKAGDAEQRVRWYKKLYYLLVETNFSAFLAPTPDALVRYQQVYGCRTSKMVINPQPRMSVMFEGPVKERKSFKILYAPTWRNVDSVKLFPFEDYDEGKLNSALEELNVDIYLHPHPIRQSVDFSAVKSKRLKVVFDKPGEDVNLYLAHYDLLITDYSSIFLEFLALDRPVMFIPYDYKDFKDRIGMFDYEGDLSTGPKVYSQAEFIKEIRNFVEGKDEFVSLRRGLSMKLNGPHAKEACEINYQYLIKQLGS